MRLLVLHHDNFNPDSRQKHFIHFLGAVWRAQGVEVIHHAGSRGLPPADIVLLHVDLSIVPMRFAKAVQAYPRVWNAGCLDIRKRSLPERGLVIGRLSEHQGPVIVKTDLNCGARPELRARRGLSWSSNLLERLRLRRISRSPSLKKFEYPIYDDVSAVPSAVWDDPMLVVEKFLPERDGDAYVVRWAYFCGSSAVACTTRAPNRVVRWAGGGLHEVVPVPPEILEYRRRIGLDYGKIDFVINGGRPLVLDVNKTIGGPDFEVTDQWITRELATGLV